MKPPEGVKVEVQDDEPEAHDAAYRSAARRRRRIVIEREWIDGTAGLDSMLAVLASGAGASVLVLSGLSPVALTAGTLLALGGGWRTLEAARKLLNRTRVVVDGETLRVTHAPIPAPAIAPIAVASITRVYAKAGDVVAIADGKPVRLVEGLSTPQAAFIADRLVEALDVTA